MDYLNLLGRIRANGMTQSDVAQKIGISPTTLNKKLRGHTDFTQTEICDLCRVLAIPDAEIPAYFFLPQNFSFLKFSKEVKKMKLEITGTPKEIAALVLAVQERPCEAVVGTTDLAGNVFVVTEGN